LQNEACASGGLGRPPHPARRDPGLAR
jgi:hypothetical protein